MSSCTLEQREHLKLYKCVKDTGNEVLSAFFDLKVLSLPQYGGHFTQFLEKEKHFLYHQWEQKKTMCCECPKFGCSIVRSKKMKNWIFEKLYMANGTVDPVHVIKRGGCIQQLCLHKFVTKNIAAHELDISVLSFLLRAFVNMSPSEDKSLETLSKCRNSICHAGSTNDFLMTELNQMWIDLETHLINLSEVRYRRIVQKQIHCFRKLEIDREEIAELSNEINSMREVVDCLNNQLNSNHNKVTDYVKKIEKLYINDSTKIQKSVSDQSRAIKQSEEAVVSVVKSEAHGVKEMYESTLAKMEDQHETTKEEMIKMRESQEELTQVVNEVLFKLKYDKPGKKNPSDKMVKECPVLWHLETPKEWNEKDVADALKDYERMSDNQDIKIKFVREGSLILLTTVPYGILHDKAKYEHAIKTFLTRMMDVCNIDTKRPCHVKATLHILEHDEVSIQHSYVLCEDKSTQMSIQQEDKCFQINIYEGSERMDTEELEQKRNIKTTDDFSDHLSLQQGIPSNSSSSWSDDVSFIPPPLVDDRHSNLSLSINGEASAFDLETRNMKRTISNRSICSADSSYGSGIYHRESRSNIEIESETYYAEGNSPISASPYLPRKWKESTPELIIEEIKPMIDAVEVSSSRTKRKKSGKDMKRIEQQAQPIKAHVQDFWIATRVFAMLGFVTGVIVTSALLWFLCKGTGTGRYSHGFTVIGCFITGGLLTVCLAIFFAAVNDLASYENIKISFSFGMTCIAAILYIFNGFAVVFAICSRTATIGRKSTKSNKEEEFISY